MKMRSRPVDIRRTRRDRWRSARRGLALLCCLAPAVVACASAGKREPSTVLPAFSHAAIGVRDMDRSLHFYRDLLGFRVSQDRTEEFPRPDGGVSERRAVYLRWREGPHEGFVVLDHQLDGPRGQAAEFLQVGLHHIGFWVEDLREIFARAEAGGATVVLAPTESDTQAYGEDAGGQVLTVIFMDPDGTLIQLDQRVAP